MDITITVITRSIRNQVRTYEGGGGGRGGGEEGGEGGGEEGGEEEEEVEGGGGEEDICWIKLKFDSLRY